MVSGVKGPNFWVYRVAPGSDGFGVLGGFNEGWTVGSMLLKVSSATWRVEMTWFFECLSLSLAHFCYLLEGRRS